VWCDAAWTESNAMNGPIAIKDTDLMIAWNHGGGIGTQYYAGDISWLAYYNRKLDDAEMDALRLGTKTPCEIPDLYMLITFARAVAATYETERGHGPNAPYVLDVLGNPTKGP